MINYPLENSGIDSILKFFKLKGSKRIFLVTGKRSFLSSGANKLIDSYFNTIEFVRFADFTENPCIEDVEKAVKTFAEERCDGILAVGGGSVIDMAKLVKYFLPKSLPFEGELPMQLNEEDGKLPLCVIPTTAGSGSECTHFAVLYIGFKKYSVSDKFLMPERVAILPSLLKSQTSYQKAVSGLDALSQSIESFWSVNSTKSSRDFSLQAIQLIIPNLYEIVHGSNSNESYLSIAHGAHLAGKAINIAKTTAPHAFSYYLTKRFNIPHGHAVAIFLPAFMDYNLGLNSQKYTNFFEGQDVLCESLDCLLPENNVSTRISAKLETYISSLGVNINYESLNIPKSEMLLALESGNHERLMNNPRPFCLSTFLSETAFNTLVLP